LKGILGKVDFDPKMKDKAWESVVKEKKGVKPIS
jgi:hypothetical protein